jgi:hypothetical protein
VTGEELLQIKKPTWLTVEPVDDPFGARMYILLNKPRALPEEERFTIRKKRGEVATHKAFIYAIIWKKIPTFHEKKEYDFIFPESDQYLSDYNLKNARLTKRISTKTKQGIILDIFTENA